MAASSGPPSSRLQLSSLPFPPVTKSHILSCSYHSWYPRFKSCVPKSRLLPLPHSFLAYLRADGIILPSDAPLPSDNWSDADHDSGIFTGTESDSDDTELPDPDPATSWRDLHAQIRSTIAELGGKVVPKLNWSAPKDATFMMPGNGMECQTVGDICLLLKSSDFVGHDLWHAFDGCLDAPEKSQAGDEEGANDGAAEQDTDIPYHLVLRKSFPLNPAMEFRCFVRRRQLLGISQRESDHFPFLTDLASQLKKVICHFFEERVQDTFPEENFTFDVYVPGPSYSRVWLLDFNPWADRTDPLQFSWLELLTMPEVESEDTSSASGEEKEIEDISNDRPLFRLVEKRHTQAMGLGNQKYSAHKLPKDVVDASLGGPEATKEFQERWADLLAGRQQEEDTGSDGE